MLGQDLTYRPADQPIDGILEPELVGAADRHATTPTAMGSAKLAMTIA